MTLVIACFTVLLFVGAYLIFTGKPTSAKEVGFIFPESQFSYSVYQSPKHSPNDLNMILEGNRIDELGYKIYKSYTTDLDKIDILIRDNQTGEIMKIVKDEDSESMIGVTHPEKGHIGYLSFEVQNNVNFK